MKPAHSTPQRWLARLPPRKRDGIIAALLGTSVAALAGDVKADDTFRALTGRWEGAAIRLLIDYYRMQGSADASKPFQREPLRLYNRAGSMYTFGIGNRRFVAIVEGDEMHLTGDGIAEEQFLARARQ
jgi:hypothetical protein